MKKKLCLIIHNVRSAYNVGSIFRTADAAGVKKIYLTGYTPAPHIREENPYFTQSQKMIKKTALGAENLVAWEKIDKIGSLIKKLKSRKFSVISLEQNEKSADFRKFKYSFPCALILGNEISGISQGILKVSDKIIAIPMRGGKESLNVTVAAGIAIYEILK